jgi:DNA (cytosine-5)-methyltransferase 1
MHCRWQVEKNRFCLDLLRRRWPEVPKYEDLTECHSELPYADVVAGGDPCPKHSRARSNGDSKSPDLSGYFLAVVARLRPWGVVRENVPAPSVDHFSAALDAIGYGSATIRLDAAHVTGQSRQRDFIVGIRQASRESVLKLFPDCGYGPGAYTTSLGTGQFAPALTTHRTRYDSRDCYVWEPQAGLRILDGDERESLAGFPPEWTVGFSEATRARMCGNAAVPAIARWIGERIMAACVTDTGG